MDAETLVSAADTFVLLRWGARAAGMVAAVAAGASAGALVMRFHPHYYRSQRAAYLVFTTVFLLGMAGVSQIDDDDLVRRAIGADRATVCAGAAALLVRNDQPEVLHAMGRFRCSGGDVLKASGGYIAELIAKAGKDYADDLELRRAKAVKARYEALMMSHEGILPDDLGSLLALEAQATHRPDPVWTVPLEFALAEVDTLVRSDSLVADSVAMTTIWPTAAWIERSTTSRSPSKMPAPVMLSPETQTKYVAAGWVMRCSFRSILPSK